MAGALQAYFRALFCGRARSVPAPCPLLRGWGPRPPARSALPASPGGRTGGGGGGGGRRARGAGPGPRYVSRSPYSPGPRARRRSTMASREQTVGARRERGAGGACGSRSLSRAGIPGQRRPGRSGTARELAGPSSIPRGGGDGRAGRERPASSRTFRGPHPAPVPAPLPADPPQAGPASLVAFWVLPVPAVPAGAGGGEPLPAALSHRSATRTAGRSEPAHSPGRNSNCKS